MTINDQIKDEKLQYDINREVVKIPALSSANIHKYEYLTGEDILQSIQQKIIQQARFTYSPLGKRFWKTLKTIEDEEEKQIKAIQGQGQGKTIKKFNHDVDHTPLIWKQKKKKNLMVF